MSSRTPPPLTMLPSVQIAPNSTTVSGYTYGGDMAVQAHVAFSKTIKGVCGFAAQPVYCAVTHFTREETVGNGSAAGKGAHCADCPPLQTVRFDHCRATPEVVDVGKLPDWPRRRSAPTLTLALVLALALTLALALAYAHALALVLVLALTRTRTGTGTCTRTHTLAVAAIHSTLAASTM